ncbi:hypothetical protein [Hyphobacterium marinum]|uniref:Uncharacterized protein n=1 Tax=Hyphobacterium marinum TaxID=3116574 RepID=A0ABU7LVJ9_9PROT|nr:hypothetical protein [Hyphobacterium sp. Y6023]MEE2565583.1 hypothetical protein [Hyphobacterium sp. Y6023]
MTRRRPFLDRTYRSRERAARQRKADFNPATMIRWAGLGAAIMIGLAVFVGFTSGGQDIAGRLGFLAGLSQPVLFGASWLDIGVIGIVAVAVAAILLRSRRTRSDEDDAS